MKKLNFLLSLGLATGVLFTSCKKKDAEPDPQMMSSTYMYEFNNGQLVPAAAYDGMHPDNFSASMTVEEVGENQTKITVTLMNSVNGQQYMIHAHDAADPATTPNGTPYNESPNAMVFSKHVNGNGGTVSVSQTVNMSYSQITTSYNGFFVVHDPLQPISTTDISTYLIVGTFARNQTPSNYMRSEFMYDFNTGQVAPQFAYSGAHASNLMGKLVLQQLGNSMTRVSVYLMNSINGEMYMVHAHDAADPATTPNGTPYNESPNSNVCSLMIMGNGGTARATQMSSMSVMDLSSVYNGFFVVHDPLQPLSTTDPTTYVLLGLFAR
jgi:hypothetical protein